VKWIEVAAGIPSYCWVFVNTVETAKFQESREFIDLWNNYHLVKNTMYFSFLAAVLLGEL